MKKFSIWMITAAMTIALVGLVLVQLYWVKNAYQVNRDRFFSKIDDKLDQVINKHEVLQTLALIDDFDRKGYIGKTNFETERKVLAQVDSTEITFKKYELNINEVIFETNPEKMMKMALERPKTIKDTNEVIKPNQLDIELIKKDSQDVDFEKLRKNRDSELFRLMRAFLQVSYSNDKLIEQSFLDSLIALELNRMFPGIKYEYEIDEALPDTSHIQAHAKPIIQVEKATIKKKLFPSAIQHGNTELTLKVLDPNKYILSEMRIVLFSSVVFLILIIYAFFYTLNTLIKQGKLSQMKSEFINNMTHELKTPITSISLATEVLLDPSLELKKEKVAFYSALIAKENNRLKSQVDRVLQMERLDRNKINLDKEQIHLHEKILDVLNSVKIQMDKNNGKLDWSLDADVDLIYGDELHVTNMIYNLVDNAIKYSGNKIEVNVKTYSDNKFIYISVTDYGIGISKDFQNRIFERFYRVPTGNLHDVKGFGLGLSYVKEMIELHGGSISVNSKIGKGSTFTISFPIYNS